MAPPIYFSLKNKNTLTLSRQEKCFKNYLEASISSIKEKHMTKT